MRKNKHAPIYVELDNTEHPLLNTLPRSIIPMKNHDIIHAILAKEGFDIERYEAILILDLDLIKVNFPEALEAE